MSKKSIIIIVCAVLAAVAAISAGVYYLGYSSGKKKAVTPAEQEISEPVCRLSDFRLYDTAVDQYASKEGFGAPYLEKYFEMTASDAKDLVEHPENWLCFQTYISIKNTDIDELSLFGIDCANNGKDGVYIFTGTSEVYSIPKKGSYVMCVPVLFHNNEFSTDEAREKLGVLDATVSYGAFYDKDDCENYNAPIALE
ncbi:MAG: hypothetical protein IJK60_05380 [Clostridia bacterium]|nr:hypothetical protein [Clostridia bacterium]